MMKNFEAARDEREDAKKKEATARQKALRILAQLKPLEDLPKARCRELLPWPTWTTSRSWI